LERLNLKNTVSQGQRRRSGKVASSVLNDVIGVNLLKGGFEVYVWKDFDKPFVKGIGRQQSGRDVLARKLTCIIGSD
jgi:hypothetical protein